MAESNNLQGLASKITEIFTSATKGVEETTNKLNGLSTALENLSKVKTDDLDKFANNLKSVINFEKEYTQLATKKIELEKMSADAERTLIALNEKKNEVAKKNKATAEDLARITEKSIQQKQVELEAIKGVSTVIDGEIRDTRRLLIWKEKINSTTKEQTNLLKAGAAAEKEMQRGLEETAAKYQIQGNSIRELEAQNKSLREITKSTDIVENSDELDKYNTIISANSFLIKANSDAATQQALNIGNYKSALEDSTDGVKTNAQALDELKTKYFAIQQQLSAGGGLDALQGDMEMNKDEFKALEDELQKVAKEILNIENASKGIKVGTENTVSFRTKMRDLREEILSMEMQMAKGVKLTDEQKQKYKELNKELTLMTDLQGDVNKKMSTLSSDTLPFDKVVTSVNMAASGMQIYTAAMNLAGVSQKSYEETMRTFASLQSMINGLNTVAMQLQDGATLSVMLNTAAQSKNILVKTAAIAVQKTLNAVIAASPYIAMAAALGALIYEIGKYIYEASDMGKISKDLKAKIDALNSALEKSVDNYAETATKIKNYRMAMESTTISAKGEKKVMDALNETLKDSGIHFETIQEAKMWLQNNSDAYITTLQNEAMATALFSLQTETLKKNLLKLKAGFEDLEDVSFQEKLVNLFTFGKSNQNIENFSNTIDDLYNNIKGTAHELQKETDIAKTLTAGLSNYGRGEEGEFFESIGFYIQDATEKGEDLESVIEKLKSATIEELYGFAQIGNIKKTFDESEKSISSLMGTFAEFLKVTKEMGKGAGEKEWAKNLKFITEDVSKLYKIFADESKKIAETWNEMSKMDMKESDFLDYNLFQQLSGQIIEEFEQLSLSVKTFSGENSEYFNSLIRVSGQYATTMSNIEQLTGVERLKKLQSLQEEVLAEYTKGENALLKLKKDNNDELKRLQEEYEKTTVEAEARAIEEKVKQIQKEQDKINQSLTNIEKTRLEHQKTVNEIQQLESDIHIQIVEQEIERERLLRDVQNEDEIRAYEDKFGVLDRLLGVYAKKTKDIRTKQTFDELFRQKKETDVAMLRNAMQLKMYETEKEALLSTIADPNITDAQRKQAENRLSIVSSTITALLNTEEDLSTKSIAINEKTNKERLKLAQEYNETLVSGITQLYSTIGSIGSEIDNLMSAIDSRRQQELDRELERIDTWKEAQLDAIDKTAMSDEDRIAKTSEVEKIAAKKSYALEVEKWKLEVQAAKRKKTMDAAAATSAYAQGMVNAYASYVEIPALMAVMMAGLTALYGIQLAAIMATPLPLKPDPPQYAEGTMYHGGGLAVVGDGGKREVVEANGKTFLTPNYATLIDLPRGAKVYKDYEDYIANRLVQNQTNGGTFDDFGIIDAIKKNKSSMSLYFDRNGIYTVSKNGIDRDTYISNTLKLNK